MNDSEKRKLTTILKKLDKLRDELNELIVANTDKQESSQENKTDNATKLLENINLLSAQELRLQLQELNYKELGDVFVGLGGASGDKKKPKAWLEERILWLSKEFSAGHKSIRES